jgi:separase
LLSLISIVIIYRNLEDLWFGPWKCLLLGELLNCKFFDRVLKNLVNDLKSKCKFDVNEGLLKIILGGTMKDNYFAKGGYCGGARSGIFSNAAHKLMSSEIAFELLTEAFNLLEVDDSMNREPVILVLDSEVQVNLLFLTFFVCCFEIV